MDQNKQDYQGEILQNRLQKRYKHLRKWARRMRISAYRLYDKDIPEIPLLMDIYGNSVSGALYERPYEKDQQEEEEWLRAMISAAAEVLDLPVTQFYIKTRRRLRGQDQYHRIAEKAEYREIFEGDLRFKVNLSDYLDTGLFLDHRRSRAMVRAQGAGKRVLNLFCYTGSFSIYAAAGKARSVDSVDLSNTYLEWAAENMALNGQEARRISPEDYNPRDYGPKDSHEGCHSLIRADALRFIHGAIQRGFRWDLIILDPPTFSNSKKMVGTLDIQRDYKELVQSCLNLLSPGGCLWFSTNAKGFKLDRNAFPAAQIQDLTLSTVDEDFRDRRVRSCYTFTL